MSVSPLDLQILYSNLKNIGQQQAAERSAEIAQQDKQAEENVRKAEEKDHKVLETRDVETGVEKVNVDEHNERQGSKKEGKDKSQEKDVSETKEKKYFEDPDIGHHIDISG